MKKSIRELLGKADAETLGNAFDSIKKEKVPRAAVSRIRESVTGAGRKEKTAAIRRWIPLLAVLSLTAILTTVTVPLILSRRTMLPKIPPAGQTTGTEPETENKANTPPVFSGWKDLAELEALPEYAEIQAVDSFFGMESIDRELDTTPVVWNGLTVWKALADALDSAGDDVLFAVTPKWIKPKSPYGSYEDMVRSNDCFARLKEADEKANIYNALLKWIHRGLEMGPADNAETCFRPCLMAFSNGEKKYRERLEAGQFVFLDRYVHDGIVDVSLLQEDANALDVSMNEWGEQCWRLTKDWYVSGFVDEDTAAALCRALGIPGYRYEDRFYYNPVAVLVVSKSELKTLRDRIEALNGNGFSSETLDDIIIAWVPLTKAPNDDVPIAKIPSGAVNA